MGKHPQYIYDFGPFRLDPSERLLLRDGEPVAMTPKAFETLLLLVERNGRLVEKDELMRALWPDSFVEESNLTNNVWALRKALGDSQNSTPYIETVPKRGYRFIAAVESSNRIPGVGGAPQPEGRLPPESAKSGTAITEKAATSHVAEISRASPASARSRLWYYAPICIVLFVGLTWAGIARRRAVRPIHGVASLAVLPLENLSRDAGQEYFADGMTDELITAVAKLPQLRVISRTSIMRFKASRNSLTEIAKQLGVDHVIEGTVMRSGGKVRVTVQLIDARSDGHLWSDAYEHDLGDVLALQRGIASDVAAQISIRLTPQEQARLSAHRPIDPAAYDAFLRGRYYWRTRSNEGLMKAIDYFNEAIRLDPSDPRPYAGLADTYLVMPLLTDVPTNDFYRRAKEAASKALARDEQLAEAHNSAAYAKMYLDWDFDGAEREFKRTLEIDPNYATGHQWYAEFLSAMSRHAEAITQVEYAKQLDPVSMIIRHQVAGTYHAARDYDRAIEEYRKAMELDPTFTSNYYGLSAAYGRKGMVEEQLHWIEASPDPTVSPIAPALRRAFRDGGQERMMLEFPELVKKSSHSDYADYFQALCYAKIGKKDQAIASLRRVLAQHQPFILNVRNEPELDVLRLDPRFVEIVRAVGFPQAH